MPEMSSRLDNIVMVVEKVVLDQIRIDGWRTGRFDARKWVEDTHVERSLEHLLQATTYARLGQR
jgi:hypothetical protein